MPGKRELVGTGIPYYVGAFGITPHDTNLLATVTSAIWVGTGGDLKVRTLNGTDVTFGAVPNGNIIYIQADRVYSTGTAASNIVGLI